MKSYFVNVKPLLQTAAKNWDRQLSRFRFGSAKPDAIEIDSDYQTGLNFAHC